MKRKVLKRVFRYSVVICFATFFALYLSQSTGYIEYENSKQVALTEKQIKEFEKDVADGKQVDMKKYLKTNEKNYQNAVSRTGLKISEVASSGIKSVVESSFKLLSKLAE